MKVVTPIIFRFGIDWVWRRAVSNPHPAGRWLTWLGALGVWQNREALG